jgi:hypothetical protein
MKHLNKFVVQLEWTESWGELSNEEMGILFKTFIAHSKGLEIDGSNRMVNVAWNSVKNQVDRMNEKYLKDIENGKRGGAPKGNQNAIKQPPNNPKTTYKDNDKDNDKDKVVNSSMSTLINSVMNSGEIFIQPDSEASIDEGINKFWEKRQKQG